MVTETEMSLFHHLAPTGIRSIIGVPPVFGSKSHGGGGGEIFYMYYKKRKKKIVF